MICICSQKLTALAELLAEIEVPEIEIPGPLMELSAMLTASMSAQLGAAGTASLGLDAAAMAEVSAAAQAMASVEAGLGIDLTAPSAQLELDATIAALNANAEAFLGLGALDPGPWLELSSLASLAMKLKFGFGVDMFSAGASLALSAALEAALAAALSAGGSMALFASAQASTSLSAMASAMGVANLGAAGGMGEFAAKLDLLAELSIPEIEVSIGTLMPPLAILGAIANISLGLGLNPLLPGFGDALADLTADLSAFGSLELPAGLDADLSAAAEAAASADASASLDASALADFEAPELGSLTAMASFVASCEAAGFSVGMSGACGAACPMSFSASV